MEFLVPFLLFCTYFLPTIVAYSKGRSNAGAILVLNLFLGWTLIGWVVALVWATASGNQDHVIAATSNGAHELQKLSELKANGVISEEEFQAQKRKIFGS